MDISNLDLLLGPFASKKPVTFKGSGNEGVTSNKQIISSSSNTTRANFGVLHKKQNIKFMLVDSSEDKRRERQLDVERYRKEKRGKSFMKNRKMAEVTDELNILIHDDSSNELSAIVESIGNGSVSTLSSTSEPEMNQNRSKPNPTPAKNGTKSRINSTNTNKSVVNVKVENGKKVSPDVVNNNKANNPATIGANKNARNAPAPAISARDASRKEQLLKWKREKEAAELAARRTQKQPFKAGATATAVPLKAKAPTNAVTKTLTKSTTSTSSVNVPKVASQPVVSRTQPATKLGAVKPGVKPDEPRRVTRAMSKAQTNGNGFTARGATGVNPAIQKMKNLNINEKSKETVAGGMIKHKPGGVTTATSARPGTSGKAGTSQPTKGQGATASKKVIPAKSASAKSTGRAVSARAQPTTNTGSGNNHQIPSNKTKSVSPISPPEAKAKEKEEVVTEKLAEVKKKKMKPKAINMDYVNYNALFSTACQQLHVYKDIWTKVMEEPETADLSEKIQGDIRSALGKVKLLLESKLPQFGELLYSFLCEQVEPMPVLSADLQGWWDVVTIQLEIVDKTFEDLTTLKNNGWNAPLPPVVEALPNSTPLISTSSQEALKPPPRAPKPKVAVKAQASGGLKDFLANKRKMQMRANAAEPTVDPTIKPADNNESMEVDKNEGEDVSKVDKSFDGGFFSICTPTPTPNRRASVRKHDGNSSVLSSSLHDVSITPASAVPAALRTPHRRLSHRQSISSDKSMRRVSMCILGVRNSMGSLLKIGAVQIFSEEAEPANNSNTSAVSDIMEAE